MKQIEVEGERIEVEEDWNCCFQPEEADQIRVLKELEIDTRLCSAITIAKTADGRFFALWSERHPEMVPIEELHGCSPGWIFRQFIKLEKGCPQNTSPRKFHGGTLTQSSRFYGCRKNFTQRLASRALLLNMNARAALAFILRPGIVFKCAAERFLQSHGRIVD